MLETIELFINEAIIPLLILAGVLFLKKDNNRLKRERSEK